VESFATFGPDEHQPDPECRDAYEAACWLYRDGYFALKPVFADSQEHMAAGPEPAAGSGRARPAPHPFRPGPWRA
jgi:hypothetical protein